VGFSRKRISNHNPAKVPERLHKAFVPTLVAFVLKLLAVLCVSVVKSL
jgi:hypothetical protein